jgi:hypothetical protein
MGTQTTCPSKSNGIEEKTENENETRRPGEKIGRARQRRDKEEDGFLNAA